MTEEVLRAKYGPPQGSKFTISAGFEIVVDCEPYGQVRRIEFPGTAHDASGASTPQRVDEVVLELVPMSIRGKEISWGQRRTPYYTKHTLYEHVMIIEAEDPELLDQRRSVTVLFSEHYQPNSTS
jgi:hypothetical protein